MAFESKSSVELTFVIHTNFESYSKIQIEKVHRLQFAGPAADSGVQAVSEACLITLSGHLVMFGVFSHLYFSST